MEMAEPVDNNHMDDKEGHGPPRKENK